jgi:hypothetical protein
MQSLEWLYGWLKRWDFTVIQAISPIPLGFVRLEEGLGITYAASTLWH